MERLRQTDPLAVDPGPLAGAFTSLVVSDEVVPPGRVFPWRDIGATTVILTETGRARATVDDRAIAHQPGTVVVMAAGIRLEERVEADAHWRSLYIMATGPWAQALDAVVRMRQSPVAAYEDAPTAWVHGLRDAVGCAFDRPAGWRWTLLARLSTLGAAIASDQNGDAAAGLVERVRRLIDRAPDRAWPTAALARAMGMGRSAFVAHFAAAAGEPPARWIRRRRCALAHDLLARGWSVTAVAQRLGFANPFHFSRVFRAITGQAPSAVGAGLGLHR